VKTLLEDLSLLDQPLLVQGGFYAYNPSLGLQAGDFLLEACSRIFPQGPEKSSYHEDELSGNPLRTKDISMSGSEEPLQAENRANFAAAAPLTAQDLANRELEEGPAQSKGVSMCELTAAQSCSPDAACNARPVIRNQKSHKSAARTPKSPHPEKPAPLTRQRSLKIPSQAEGLLTGSSQSATVQEVEYESR